MASPSDVRRMLAHLRPEVPRYGLGLLSLFVVNLSDVLAPLFLATAVDLVAAELGGPAARTPPLLAWAGLEASALGLIGAAVAFIALSVIANAARYPMQMQIGVPSHRIGQRLRNALVDKLLRLPRTFYDRASSGDLMSRATSDIGAVRMFFGPGIMIGSDTVFLVVLVLTAMFSMSWELTLIALLPLPLIALVTNVLSHAEFKRSSAVQEDLARLTEQARESYAGASIIQGYAREGYDRARFEAASARHRDVNLALARVNALFEPTLDLMLGLSTVLVLTWGGIQVIEGALSIGAFIAFLFLVRQLSGPMIGFGWAVSLFQRGRASHHRLEELHAEPLTILDAPDARPSAGPGRLTLHDLTFTYPKRPDEPSAPQAALRGVSLEVEPGQRVGIIGPVGSGKSTLVSLLTRLYEPPAGSILLDGEDIREVKLEELRGRIVLAPQETFLFSDTVARNIDLTQPHPSPESIRRLLELACLRDEIDALPQGIDALLGPRGVNLSGGQRQRLAIARAIGAAPDLLILDDCLSAVDSRTEDAILANLDVIFAGRAGIIVSHRVAAVSRCDLIVVLQGGQITQRGTHDALLRAPGYYAEIAREQTRGDHA